MGLKLISLPLLVLGVLTVLSMSGFSLYSSSTLGYVNFALAGRVVWRALR